MKINYTPHLLVYLDLLGFKELISNENEVEKIYNILSEARKELLVKGMMYNKKSKENFGQFTFSDLFVRAINIDDEIESKNYQNLLRREIIILGLAQSYLIINNDTLIRGAITIDDLYFNKSDSIVVGPALVNAYKLESKSAVYPRIIIDPNIISKIGESFFTNEVIELNDLKEQDDFTGNAVTYGCLQKDLDGMYFIDYLEVAVIMDFPNDYELWIDFMQKHKKSIQEKISNYSVYNKTKTDISIFQKVSWLKNYHNKFIKRKISYFEKEQVSTSDLIELLIE